MLLEYARKGDLSVYLQSREKISEQEASHYLFQLLHAINHIHNQDIIHRDIKLDNILINEDLKVKLCDFGWVSPPGDPLRHILCGTYQYMPPEVILQKPYDCKVDIWSFGICAYELIHGFTPFVDKSVPLMTHKILNSTFKIDDHVSQPFRNLLNLCINPDPSRRPTAAELIKHDFFHNVFSYYYTSADTGSRKYQNDKLPEGKDNSFESKSRVNLMNYTRFKSQQGDDSSRSSYDTTPKSTGSQEPAAVYCPNLKLITKGVVPAELMKMDAYRQNLCDIEPAEPSEGITFENIHEYVEFDIDFGGALDYIKEKGNSIYKLFYSSPQKPIYTSKKYKTPVELKRILNKGFGEESYHSFAGFKSPINEDSFKVRSKMNYINGIEQFRKDIPDTPELHAQSPAPINMIGGNSSPPNTLMRMVYDFFGSKESPKPQTSIIQVHKA